MSGPISIQCPKCSAKLKLKNDNAVGKKVPCPKCKKPFVVEAPPEDDFDDFGDLDEFGAYDDDYGDEFDEAPASPRRRSSSRGGSSSRSSRGKKKRKKSGGANWVKPVLIGFGALAVLSLMVGVGYMGVSLLGGGGAANNKIDLAYLPPDAELFVAVKMDAAWNAPLVQSLVTTPAGKQQLEQMTRETGVSPADIESIVFGASGISDAANTATVQPNAATSPLALVPGLDSVQGIAVIRIKSAVDTKKLTGDGKPMTHGGETYYLPDAANPSLEQVALYLPNDKTLVVGNEADVKAAIDRGDKQERRADLDFINEKHHLLFVMVPKNPQSLMGSQNQSLAGMPGPLESVRSKLDGKVRATCFGVTMSDGVQVEVQGACLAAADAATAEKEINTLLNEGKQKLAETESSMPPSFAGVLTVAKSVLQSIQVSTDGDTFAVNATVSGANIETIKQQAGPLMMAGMLGGLGGGMPGGGAIPGAGLPGGAMPPIDGGGFPSTGTPPAETGLGDAIAQAREAGRRAQCKNNLKQIGLAMHNFHDMFKHFAPSGWGVNGTPNLSWRVHILPHVDQGELYRQFKLDEPWDSPHNKALIAKMPPIYACPSGQLEAGTTAYLGVSGERSIFNGSKIIKIRDVTDGSSNTVMVVEVDPSRAVIWTKPDDFAWSETNPKDGLAGHHQGGFNALFVDGSVKFLPATIAVDTLKALFTRDGNEPVKF